MVTKLHLHANLPHDIDKPNTALGYLKSALSQEHLDITNVYWYLQPKKVMDLISSLLNALRSSHFYVSHQDTLLAAYLSRFLYAESHTHPTMAQSILKSYVPLKKIKRAATAFKGFIDYTLETENMADVDIAGFTVRMYQWFINKYIWSQLKEKNPNITIVVGGLDTAEEALAFMKTFKDIDCAVWGEGELPLKELVHHYDDSLAEVPHLVYRDKEGLHLTDTSSGRATIYPFADHTDYFERVKRLDLSLSPHIPIISTRSCRWNKCKFCTLNKGGVYHERPAAEVVKEIEYQSAKYNINDFFFSDSDVGRKTEESFKNLLRLLLNSAIDRKKPYNVWAEVTPLRLTKETVQMMSNIRVHVQIGFEALADSLLKKMNKMHGFAENIQALKCGNEYGITIFGLNILRNLPGECEADVLKSMDNVQFLRFFLKKYHLTTSELVLHKGAQYYKEIPLKEREKRWVVNPLYTEIEQLGLINKDDRWDFFGFTAHNLMNAGYWEQISDFIERIQTNDIQYSWLEFPDGTSLIEEHNEVNGSKNYILDEIETQILKFCDIVTFMQQVYDEFPDINIDPIISQLQGENLLYIDEKGRLISIISKKNIKKME